MKLIIFYISDNYDDVKKQLQKYFQLQRSVKQLLILIQFSQSIIQSLINSLNQSEVTEKVDDAELIKNAKKERKRNTNLRKKNKVTTNNKILNNYLDGLDDFDDDEDENISVDKIQGTSTPLRGI